MNRSACWWWPGTRSPSTTWASPTSPGPSINAIALTPAPTPHEDVVFAVRAGASGFVDVDTDPDGFAAAVRATHRGEIWLPPAEVRDVLGSVAEDLDITSSERRTRLTGLALGLIPLMGAMACCCSGDATSATSGSARSIWR